MTQQESLRVDVLLHRLCITRSRNEAKAACDSGAVEVDGNPARASREVTAGSSVTIRFPRRTLPFEVLALPGNSTSKKAARELYDVIPDERPEGSL